MKTKAQREWQAEKYHENSGAQQEAAIHLLKVLNLKGTEEILDIGSLYTTKNDLKKETR